MNGGETVSSCPDEGVLRLLGTDLVGDSTYAAVESHIEGCDVCKTALERLARRRPAFAGLLPAPKRWPDIPGFMIRDELGRGAMGVVYLAVEEGLDRLVALKVLPASNVVDDAAGPRRRWLREARALSSIRHPNAVPLYDYGEADGWFYLVLEYIPGGTLKRRLGNPLPPPAAAGLLETIARAVGCFHAHGLLHLDLKPSNILVDGEDDAPWDRVTPRVSDFGLALSDRDLEYGPSETSLAGPRGTPQYMAPEQATGSRGHFGPATDIHALGAILYELLTGRPPYQGASTLDTLEQVRSQEPVPPRRLNSRIPRDLETITLRCLEKHLSRRYLSAGAMADDLRRWLDGRPITSRPASSLEKAWRWCLRRPAIAVLAASLALTMGLGFLTVLLLWRHAESERLHTESQRVLAQAERDRADAERRQAEADFQTTSEVLGEIVELSTGGHVNVPRVVRPEKGISTLLATRKHLIELAARRPEQPMFFRQLWTVEQRLFMIYSQAGRGPETRSLLEESLGYCDRVLSRDPHDRWGLRWRTLCSVLLAQVAEEQRRWSDGVLHLRRAVRSGEALIDVVHDAESINLLAESRRSLSRFLTVEGKTEEANSLLVANRRMLERTAAESKDARMAAMRLFSYLDLSHIRPASIPATSPASSRVRSDSELPDALSRLTSSESHRLTPQEWGGLALEALLAKNASDTSRPSEYAAGYELSLMLGIVAAEQRHAVRLGEAWQTVDRNLAVGRLLVTRYPNQPLAHLALAEAYVQAYKNAWHPMDRVAIEKNLELALDAALQALALDPGLELSMYQVNSIQRKLRGLRESH